MKKLSLYFLGVTIFGSLSFTTLDSKSLTEEEFHKKISTENFTELEIKELIQITNFESGVFLIERCNGGKGIVVKDFETGGTKCMDIVPTAG